MKGQMKEFLHDNKAYVEACLELKSGSSRIKDAH